MCGHIGDGESESARSRMAMTALTVDTLRAAKSSSSMPSCPNLRMAVAAETRVRAGESLSDMIVASVFTASGA